MRQTTYITDMALKLADECENYTIPVHRSRLETSLEVLILVDALNKLHSALVKLSKLLAMVEEN